MQHPKSCVASGIGMCCCCMSRRKWGGISKLYITIFAVVVNNHFPFNLS